jgi:alpha-beta hydrolase superfamily lysophospholipase
MAAPPPRIDFYTALDGRRLATRVWNATEQPSRGRVVMLHGITSHGGWYNRSCEHLAAAGFDVHFLDRRGSGLNCEEPGDVDRWQTWLDDISAYLQQNAEQRPTVLAGISWGGKLAAAFERQHPGLVRGLALICPGLYSPHEPRLAKRLALGAPVPARVQYRRLPIPLRRASLFTDRPQGRRFIANDPLALRDVTWRFAREDRQLTKFARGAAPFLHTPLLMVLAGRDKIVNNRRTHDYFFRTTTAQRTMLEYPNASHTLEFEPDAEQYFADLADWIALAVSR